MILKRNYKVAGVGNTKAKFFEDTEVGDRLRASITLRDNTRYSPEVVVENLTQGTERTDRMGRMYAGLQTLELIEID